MSYYRIVLTFLLAFSYTVNQAQQGNQWMLGWIGGADFNSGTFQYYSYADTINIRQTTCGISDTNGQVRIWSNGSEIFRSDRSILGSVPHLPFSNSFVQSGNGLNIYQGAIVIPEPGTTNQYYLFYASQEYVANAFEPINLNTHLYYSKLDMNANGGLGSITANGIHVEDSLHTGNMIAIKHANGRDWWLLAHKIKSDQYVSWLISPNGISVTNYQSIGFNIWNFEYIGSLASSAQGDKIASMIGDAGPQIFKRLEVLDFDRCSGILSNVVFASYQDSGIYLPRAQFSPSGQYVYSTSSWFLYQFDTQAGNFQSSQYLIDIYDSTFAPFEADFQLMERAPDGKIYCHSRNGNWSLHVINDPDSAGVGCNFVQNQFSTGIWYSAFVGLPNIPNYELSSLSGSICDSLTGLSYIQNESKTIKVYPNPSKGSITIQYKINPSNNGYLEIINILGETVYSKMLSSSIYLDHIDLGEYLLNGVYFCRISSDNDVDVAKILIKR